MHDNVRQKIDSASTSPTRATASFFVFRTPLLPLREFLKLGDNVRAYAVEGAELDAAWRADIDKVRQGLMEQFRRPELKEAIYIASPSLYDALPQWEKDPDSARGRRTEQSLIRYLTRMTFRCTPFGMFAASSVGKIGDSGEKTSIVFSEWSSHRRRARLDMYYVTALCERFAALPELRERLNYRVNTSLYKAGGMLRYVVAQSSANGRTYRLVALESTDYLEAIVNAANTPVHFRQLVALLVDRFEVGEEEAREYLKELIDSQVLISDVEPCLTGPEATSNLIESLKPYSDLLPEAKTLAIANELLMRTNDSLPGTSIGQYAEVESTLKTLQVSIDRSKLIQVDMIKEGSRARLGQAVLADIQAGAQLLRGLDLGPTWDPLAKFKEAFAERYEQREVPLVEVLDEEMGIGLPASVNEQAGKWTGRDSYLLQKLEDLPPGIPTLVLSDADVQRMSRDVPYSIANAYSVQATIDARSADDVNSGNYRILLRGVTGPSGAALLGRFCHVDPELELRVREHLQKEQDADPDSIMAEVVHLPEGRLGNVIQRPVLRQYEIPFLGRSSICDERRIPVSDLLVSMRGGKVILRSKALDRIVKPRLTSAHGFSRGLTIYRFLCFLQGQGVQTGLFFSWGLLESRRYLPRLEYKNFVLSLARWVLDKEELKTLAGKTGAERFAALRQLAKQRNLPRYFAVPESDNVLLVDLWNPISVESFFALIEDRSQVTLQELFPAADHLMAEGPEGRFTHELVVPFCESAKEETAVAASEKAALRIPSVPSSSERRVFPPGSECLYLKIYAGRSTADQLLAEALVDLVAQAREAKIISEWFFIRYADPDSHLRIRFFGHPKNLFGLLVPEIETIALPLLDSGRIWKIQFDTYVRETERYGGPKAIGLAERFFHADSEACLSLVAASAGDEGANVRWQFALLGLDFMLGDFGLAVEQKYSLLSEIVRKVPTNEALEHQLSLRYRKERKTMDALFARKTEGIGPLEAAFNAFRERSKTLEPIIAKLSTLERAGELTTPILDLIPSYLHMHTNRLLHPNGLENEFTLYDMLFRYYESAIARARRSRSAKSVSD